jgi:hypothetical protein
MLIWLFIIPLAFINGAFRQIFLEPRIGSFANPVSCIILCILAFFVSFIFIPRLGKGTIKIYLKMGLLWITLTIIFETMLGIVMGNTCNEIINAYNITTGNFWLFVVIFIGFVPILVGRCKRII